MHPEDVAADTDLYHVGMAVCGIGGARRTAQVFVGSDDGFPSEQLLLLIDTVQSSLRSPQAPILLHSLAILLQRSPLISHLSPSFYRSLTQKL